MYSETLEDVRDHCRRSCWKSHRRRADQSRVASEEIGDSQSVLQSSRVSLLRAPIDRGMSPDPTYEFLPPRGKPGCLLLPVVYNSSAPAAGSQWTWDGFYASTIPRMYHSTATLLVCPLPSSHGLQVPSSFFCSVQSRFIADSPT